MFRLYDTHGISLETMEEASKEVGMRLDTEKFNILLDAKREASRAEWKAKYG